MTTKQALAELKKLAKESADNLYRRIELADTVLQDLDWIARVHGGSDLKAQDALESEFFGNLGGYVTLGKLRAMFRNVPKAKWAELRYHVQAVELVYDEQAKPEKHESGQRTAWKQVAEERQDRLEAVERKAAAATEAAAAAEEKATKTLGRVEQLQADNAWLREENARLREENTRLRVRLQAMESREPAMA